MLIEGPSYKTLFSKNLKFAQVLQKFGAFCFYFTFLWVFGVLFFCLVHKKFVLSQHSSRFFVTSTAAIVIVIVVIGAAVIIVIVTVATTASLFV